MLNRSSVGQINARGTVVRPVAYLIESVSALPREDRVVIVEREFVHLAQGRSCMRCVASGPLGSGIEIWLGYGKSGSTNEPIARNNNWLR